MSRARGSRLEQARATSAAVQEAAPGLTARQLEYWVLRGWIVPDQRVQGHPRAFSASELRVLAVMRRLTLAGFHAALAAPVAREAVRSRRGAAARVELASGVWVEVTGA